MSLHMFELKAHVFLIVLFYKLNVEFVTLDFFLAFF